MMGPCFGVGVTRHRSALHKYDLYALRVVIETEELKDKLIGVGTGGATGAMAPSLLAKIILKIFPFFLKYNFDTENHPPGRGEHNSVLKCIVDGLVFAGHEIEVSLAPSLFVTFLRPWINSTTMLLFMIWN